AISLDQAGDGVERRGLTGTVWTKQTNGFAATDVKTDPVNDRTTAVGFFQAVGSEIALMGLPPGRRRLVALAWCCDRPGCLATGPNRLVRTGGHVAPAAVSAPHTAFRARPGRTAVSKQRNDVEHASASKSG